MNILGVTVKSIREKQMRTSSSVDDQYWNDYDGLQAVKHRILGDYLNAWFPILSTFGGHLLYLDCHAGRGRHETGDPGSPILVLDRLRDHTLRRQILKRVIINCHFFERSQSNADRLEDEIAQLGHLDPRIRTYVHPTDYEAALSQILDRLESTGTMLPPSFAFIDPYGFKLSMNFMNRVLRAGRTETLINFMCRYVDMALRVPDKTAILDELFGTREWHHLSAMQDYEQRVDETVRLFANQLQAEHVSWVIMRSVSGTIKYILFHATNSLKGRRVMKRTMWRVLPDGSFTAYERDRPEQGVLISVKQSPAREVVELIGNRFGGKTVLLVDDVYPVVDASPFRRKHVHEILSRAVSRNVVGNLTDPGKFVARRNPHLVIPHDLPESLAEKDKVQQSELFG